MSNSSGPPAQGSEHHGQPQHWSTRVPTIQNAERREHAQAPGKPHPEHSRPAPKPPPPSPSSQHPTPRSSTTMLQVAPGFLVCRAVLDEDGSRRRRKSCIIVSGRCEAGVDPVRPGGALMLNMDYRDGCQDRVLDGNMT